MTSLSLLDLSFPAPAENLACDEALLDECEANPGAGVLRFWELSGHAVVLGYANHAAAEADLEACREASVPVLRRCSGGGTVLLGPGCLNYTLVLPTDHDSSLSSITGTNRFIMERHRAVVAALLPDEITVEGHTDLAINGRKFSGNAQRRRKRAVLFHGTFLLDYDIELVEGCLGHPSRRPAYRQDRTHREFLTRLPLTMTELKVALQKGWSAIERSFPVPRARIEQLMADRYERPEWNLRW